MSPSVPLSQNLPGARKAAIFLMGIGDQISADLIRQLAPEEIRRISSEITALSSVQPDHMLYIFREFESLTATSRFFAKGGFDRAKKLLEQAVGPDSAMALMKDAPPLRPRSGTRVNRVRCITRIRKNWPRCCGKKIPRRWR